MSDKTKGNGESARALIEMRSIQGGVGKYADVLDLDSLFRVRRACG
jgi:hypothetical protein